MHTMKEVDFDTAISVLSNEYRRKILKLITMKERYPFELSKILEISQRAVSKHLEILAEEGLVESEKRKSTKGPEREYFTLNKAVVISITVAPNLYLATIRSLDETSSSHFPASMITPDLQLSSASAKEFQDVIKEGLNLLPQIKEGLELIEVQQSKLLRGYQGIRNHIKKSLESNGFTALEIRYLLHLIEHDGDITMEEMEFAMGEDANSIIELTNNLKQKQIIETDMIETENGNLTVEIKLKDVP